MENKGSYHNGASAGEFPCTLSLSGKSLHIFLNDEARSLLIWNLEKITYCQLIGNSLTIKYGRFPFQILEFSGEFAKEVYTAWSKNKILKRTGSDLFTWGRISVLAFLSVFILFSLLSWFVLLPWIGERALSLVPRQLEINLGESLSLAYKKSNNINDSAGFYLNEFIGKLDLHCDYPLKAQVIISEEINAFALPGGEIFVYSGILDKIDNAGELTALLGHEVTHVVNRHSLRSILRSTASGFVIAVLFGDVGGISTWVVSRADDFQQLNYSRTLETEADNNGLKIMKDNRIDPRGMLELLELLKKESVAVPDLMKYLSSHPDTDSRIQNVSSNLSAKWVYKPRNDLALIFSKLKARL